MSALKPFGNGIGFHTFVSLEFSKVTLSIRFATRICIAKLPEIIFEGEYITFTIPEKYRNARLFLVTFYAEENSVFSDDITVYIKNGETGAGVFKYFEPHAKAYLAKIKMENYIISKINSTAAVALLRIKRVVVIY